MSAPTSPPSNATAPATTPPPTAPSPPAPVAPAPTPPVTPAPPPKAPPPAVSPPPPSAATPPAPAATTPPPASPATPATPAPPPSTTPDTPLAPPPPVNTPGTPPSPPSPSSNPSPSHPSPSKPNSPPSPPSPSSPSSSSSLSTGVVVGVAAGGIVVLLLLSLICVCCWKKKKRRRDDIPMHYSMPPPPPPPGMYKDEQYARPYQHQQWQQQPSSDHLYKPSTDPLPPPPYGSRPPPAAPAPPPPPPPPPHSSGGSGSNYSGGGDHLPPPSPGIAFAMSKSTFTYEELVIATNGFSDEHLLGQGGFGYVHKGVLPTGKEIAVKQLKVGSGQGEREFQAEVEIISRVHHKHLVSLVGYCISGGQRLLVYEFVPNNTLEYHLHGRGRPTMEWSTRLRIALGSAKGLAYLHEDCHPKIIHRDIKASNILLDHKFEAKVADFGLAKFTEDNNTHVSTRVMGTFGYLAPEYASSGKLTEKSDVFSYGVMLLELITGRRPVDTNETFMDESLVDWARNAMAEALKDGNYEKLVDPKLLPNNYVENEMARMIAVAAACVRHSAKRRPRMSQVVRALEGDTSLDDLHDGTKPGHSRFMGGSYTSSEFDSSSYNEDMKRFRKMAFQSTTDSQYSAPTSEYGLNPSGSSSEGGGGGGGQYTREMELGKLKSKNSY